MSGNAGWRFVGHLGRLLGDVVGFAWHNRAWWIVPTVFILLLLALLIVVGSGATPLIYAIF